METTVPISGERIVIKFEEITKIVAYESTINKNFSYLAIKIDSPSKGKFDCGIESPHFPFFAFCKDCPII